MQPKKEVTPDVNRALHEAVAAIYLNDNSDYLPALWSVVRALDPKIAKLLERNGSKAFDTTFKRCKGE